MSLLKAPLSLLGLALFNVQVAHASELEMHGAHTHGISSLDVVLDAQTLSVSLYGPAANFLGFEHVPESHAQWDAVHAAQTKLEAGVLALPAAAGCTLASVDVDMPYKLPEEHHDEHHGEHHDEHHDHDHHNEGGHTEIEANYTYECKNPAAISALDVQAFAQFEHTEEINYQAIMGMKQSGGKLSASNHNIRIK